VVSIRFSHFMRRKFMLPVRWDYFMVSEYDNNPGDGADWSAIQREVTTDLCSRIPEIQDTGVMAIAWMAYQDSPDQHNLVYGQAEYHKGLITFPDGARKPNIWDIWNTCGQ